ncbi:MAG: hypothetical protein Q9178_003153 [Gyalolechia marmorata]
MHEQYGPIVRINPEELHIQDTEFYDQLYRRDNKLDKFPGQTKMFGMPGTFFTTETHELHRERRSPFLQSVHFIKHLSFISALMQALPDTVMLWLRPSLRLAMHLMKVN